MPQSSRPPVLATAVGVGGVGEQIVKALAQAPAPGWTVIGAEANPERVAVALDSLVELPPAANADLYVDAVIDRCRATGAAAVLPGSEAELRVLARHAHDLEAQGILAVCNPADVIETCLDKLACQRALAAAGHAPPRTWPAIGEATLDAVDIYPVVVKPMRNAGGSRDCFIVQTPRELASLLALFDADTPLLVQEYCGSPQEEYTVGVLFDLQGVSFGSIALRRSLHSALNVRSSVVNRSGRAELGPRLVVSSGVSEGLFDDFPHVRAACERAARALGARGPLNVQCRVTAADEVRIFEVNPRFSGTTAARAIARFNEPDILLRRHLLGEDVAKPRPHAATMRRRLVEHVTLRTQSPEISSR